jgi:hypothetical protein
MDKMTAFWDVVPRSLAEVDMNRPDVKAVRTSQTPVYFNETTRRYIAEVCHLQIRRRENVRSHKVDGFLSLADTTFDRLCPKHGIWLCYVTPLVLLSIRKKV